MKFLGVLIKFLFYKYTQVLSAVNTQCIVEQFVLRLE